MLKPAMIILAAALSLAACGRDPGTRALSGGALGAGLGAGTAAITGGNVGTGAIIGGVGGAAVGGLTNCHAVGRC
ncbi:osmotically inducible lipoprotein OsmB [Inquilinus ginsengisoli]|jgi:osmotically inducible lipoprotein OsmB